MHADPRNLKAAETIFTAALAVSPAERAFYLAGACGDDLELRQRVDALLRAHDESERFLPEQPRASTPLSPLGVPAASSSQTESANADARSGTVIGASTEGPGIVIGRYKLLEQVGEGGFGVVYLAEQREPVRRRVALKIIKLGMDTRQVIARFEAERQALALMDHPNIAKVLDAGATETGRPYFVMELVKGISITQYCDQQKVGINERLELVIKVCHAIQHAHQKGIIHRDIKPSNILITLHDGVPIPKVIDFGIVKATQLELTDKTIYTHLQQFIGTPAYMSPEQAEMSGLDIDTRSDIYSLGVLLYELLTGSTPFDTKELLESGLDELRRTIREKEPVRPSTRLTQLRSKNQSKKRRSCSDIDADLDWIVMKCLEKDRTRRYETSNSLAVDLRRHLNSEPVVARPPSAAYKLQKAYRRHKLVFAAAASVLVALLCGVVASAWQAMRARHAEQATLQERQLAREESAAAREARRLAASRLARLNVSEAWFRVRAGDFFGALPLLADALQADQNDPERAAMHRLRLASVLQQCPKVVQVWYAGGPLTAAEISPCRTQILTAVTIATNRSAAQIWELPTGRPLTPPMEHSGAISFVQWSKDRTKVATASADKTAQIWDAFTGRPLSPPLRHENPVTQASFNSTGTLVFTASASDDHRQSNKWTQPQVTLWDVGTGDLLWRTSVKVLSNMTSPICISPDERLVVAGTEILEAHTGKVLSQLADASSSIHQVEFDPKGTRVLLTGHFGAERNGKILNGDDLQQVLAVTPGLSHPIYGRFSPSGDRIVTYNNHSSLHILNAATGLATIARPIYTGRINSIAFSPDERFIVAGCRNRAARIFDASTGASVAPPLIHGDEVRLAAFDANSSMSFTACQDGVLAVWDLRAAAPPFTWAGLGSMFSFAISPDSRLVAGRTRSGAIYVWNLVSGELALPPFVSRFRGGQLQFNSDSTKLFDPNAPEAWEVATGRPLKALLNLPMSSQARSSFRRNGELALVSLSQTSEVHVFSTKTGIMVAKLDTANRALQVLLNPEGTQVVGYSTNGTVLVWDLPSSKLILQFETGEHLGGLEFSGDSSMILTYGRNQARVWNARTGKPVTPPLLDDDGILSAKFSPDGKWVETRSIEFRVQIWNVSNGLPLPWGMRVEAGRDVAFSPNGKLVAFVSEKEPEVIQLRDLATGNEVMPPLVHASGVTHCEFTPNSRWLLTLATIEERFTVRAWELSHDNRPVSHWRALAAFFHGDHSTESNSASQFFGGTLAPELENHNDSTASSPIGPSERLHATPPFAARWQALRQRDPSDFFRSGAELDAWQRHVAAKAEERKDWPEAVHHLTRLLQGHLDSAQFLPRRARAYANWAKQTTPADTNYLQCALDDYDQAIAQVEQHRELGKQSRKLLLLERSEVFLALNRRQEAESDFLEGNDIPARPTNSPAHSIDLTPWYNASLDDLVPPTYTLVNLLKDGGPHKLSTGVVFDVRGLVVLGSPLSRGPKSITGIHVNRQCHRVHFLHTVKGQGKVGTTVATIVMHLANGERETLELKFGDDVGDATFSYGESETTTSSRVAWTGPVDRRAPQGLQIQLFQTTWENPMPETAVESIDYVSGGKRPIPVLVAITVEPVPS